MRAGICVKPFAALQTSSLFCKASQHAAGTAQTYKWVFLCRGENKTSSDMQVYGTSKVYLIMASKALNEKLKGTGVEVFAAHPGDAL